MCCTSVSRAWTKSVPQLGQLTELMCLVNQQRISNQTSANHLARQTMASHELVDPRMNDRNWIAAYPDPGDRSLALINTPNEGISRTDVLVSGLQTDVSKVASVKKKRTRKTTPALTGGTVESTGLQSALAGAKIGSKKQSSEKADPNVQIRRKRSSRHATGTIAPLSDLVSYPFWIGGPNSPCQPAKNTSKPDPDTALRWTSSTEPTRPNTCELSSSSPDITAQSSKGYIQQRPPELPSHYSKVILRSLAPTRGHVGTFSDETSESSSFGSDVYSDPGLRSFGFQSHANEHGSSDEECLTISGSLHTCNLTHSADSTGRPYLNHREGSSDGQTSFEGLSIPRARQIHDISSGAQSCKIVAPAIDNIEEAKLWLDDQRGLSVQRTIEHVALIYSDDSEIDENEVTKSTKVGNTVASKSSSTRSCTGTEFVSTCLDKSARDQDHLDVITQPASVCSSTAEDKGRFLFTIDLDNRRRDVHEREKPSDVVAALCRDHAVEDSDTRERFEHAITAKFQKAFKKLQREQPCP